MLTHTYYAQNYAGIIYLPLVQCLLEYAPMRIAQMHEIVGLYFE